MRSAFKLLSSELLLPDWQKKLCGLPRHFATLQNLYLQKETMPTYHVEMMEGRTVEQKTRLVAEITRVSVEILGGEAASVDIIITDIKRDNWATGGKLWSAPRE